jgi:hypothetical protein
MDLFQRFQPPLENPAVLYRNQTVTAYVNYAGNTVVMGSPRPYISSSCHFSVLDTQEINAFACMGGFIFVTKGLLRVVRNGGGNSLHGRSNCSCTKDRPFQENGCIVVGQTGNGREQQPNHILLAMRGQESCSRGEAGSQGKVREMRSPASRW